MTKHGVFITFEGTDGCGKSTQFAQLVGMLKALGIDLVLTREPGGTFIGEKIRDLLLDCHNSSMSLETEAYLYAASRAQNVREVIIPSIAAGKVVVSDRFLDSSEAYQGAGRGLGIETVLRVNELAVNNIKPDLTIILALDPKIALERRKNSGNEMDRLEQAGIELQEKAYRAYMTIAKQDPKRIFLVNGDATPHAIHVEIQDKVLAFLKKHGHIS